MPGRCAERPTERRCMPRHAGRGAGCRRTRRIRALGWFVTSVVTWGPSEAVLSTASRREPAGQRPDGGRRAPEAVLWDMDGTLVDTEPYWVAAETEVVAAHGKGVWSKDDALLLVGNDLLVSGSILQRRGQ